MEMNQQHDGQGNLLLEKEHILRICLNDKTKVVEFITHSLPLLQESVGRIKGALAKHDDGVFLKELHKLKGSLGVISPRLLFGRAESLENSTKSAGGTIDPLEARQFTETVEQLLDELQVMLINFKR
jgi:HPt (histidine-containing phosphotransfer) domain-containing protein